jgi:hypothetical protein
MLQLSKTLASATRYSQAPLPLTNLVLERVSRMAYVHAVLLNGLVMLLMRCIALYCGKHLLQEQEKFLTVRSKRSDN